MVYCHQYSDIEPGVCLREQISECLFIEGKLPAESLQGIVNQKLYHTPKEIIHLVVMSSAGTMKITKTVRAERRAEEARKSGFIDIVTSSAGAYAQGEGLPADSV